MRTATNEKNLFPWGQIRYAGGIQGTPLRMSPDLTGYVPNALKGIEVSKDFKVINLMMRKCIKWSDG
jgi:hypothetical protein